MAKDDKGPRRFTVLPGGKPPKLDEEQEKNLKQAEEWIRADFRKKHGREPKGDELADILAIIRRGGRKPPNDGSAG
jgi:hypothetical protein